MPQPPAPPQTRRPGARPLRRTRVEPAAPDARRRRIVHILLVFVTVVLLVDALVGEKGLLDTVRARREHMAVASQVDALRRENQQLRDDIRRLYDARTIESLAREELGLIRPGEMLFIIRDR